MKTTIKIMILTFVIAGCGKVEVMEYYQPQSTFGNAKFGSQSTENKYGLTCSISAEKTSIVSLSDFIINYAISNNSSVDFEENVYISLDLIHEDTYAYYYSLLWWKRTSWGRTSKLFMLQRNSEVSQSVNIADIGWINSLSSAIQPTDGNFYNLFQSGSFKFQLSITVDDNDGSTTQAPTMIYSNVLDLIIE